MMSGIANPFRTWAELARGLRDRFVGELGDKRPFSPYAGEVVGMLAANITHLEHLSVSLGRLQEKDAEAYDAFLRALEKS